MPLETITSNRESNTLKSKIGNRLRSVKNAKPRSSPETRIQIVPDRGMLKMSDCDLCLIPAHRTQQIEVWHEHQTTVCEPRLRKMGFSTPNSAQITIS